MGTALIRLLAALHLALPITALSLEAQSVRARSTTTARYVQLRPIGYDTGAGVYRALPLAYASPVTQDFELSAWGLGVPGLRAYTLLRARTALGSEVIWPRFDDHFDALVAFVELDRPRYRMRLGRQHRSSGLGWYAFDGLTATWRPRPVVRTEVYGGRGFTRGFLEPVSSEALQTLDPLRPEQNILLIGASVWAAPSAATSVTAVYQREVLSDLSGLVSERAAIDARVGIGPRLLLTGATDADLGYGTWGRARLGALLRLDRRSFLELEAFRYRPLLDLTTIWGAFSPEPHRGLAATARYAPSSRLGLSTSYTYRRYERRSSPSPFLPNLDDHAHHLAIGAHYMLGDFACDLGYRLNLGFGGAQSGADVALSHAPPEGWRLGVRGAAFQQEEAFRVADGTVFGLGAEARGRLGDRLGLRAELMRYFHRRLEGQVGADWSQTRGLLAVEWTFGANPDRAGYR